MHTETRSQDQTDLDICGLDDVNEAGDGNDILSLIKGFFEDCRMRNLAPVTMSTYGSYMRTFARFCRDRGIDPLDLKDEDVLAYIEHMRVDRANCHKSLTNMFTAVTSFYQYLLFVRKVKANPIPPIASRYLRTYKSDGERKEKKVLTVDEMADLIGSVPDVRDRAVLMVLAKTGMRRNELITLDVEDVDLEKGQIVLKPTSKRSNRVLFIDDECVRLLTEWLVVRKGRASGKCPALFFGRKDRRISRGVVYRIVREWAEMFGYSDPASKQRSDHLTPHCFRHWFTTHLIRNGMDRDFVKELRGDARREAIDLYNHIDREELRRDYLARIPRLLDGRDGTG